LPYFSEHGQNADQREPKFEIGIEDGPMVFAHPYFMINIKLERNNHYHSHWHYNITPSRG